jgi:hypothetical protein
MLLICAPVWFQGADVWLSKPEQVREYHVVALRVVFGLFEVPWLVSCAEVR